MTTFYEGRILAANRLLPGRPSQWVNCACVPTGCSGAMIVLRKKKAITAEETGKDLMIAVLHVVSYCVQSTFMGTHASHPCNSPEGGHITTSPFYMEEMKVQRV